MEGGILRAVGCIMGKETQCYSADTGQDSVPNCGVEYARHKGK